MTLVCDYLIVEFSAGNGSKDTDGIQWPGAEKKLKRETDKDKDFTRIFGGDLLDLSDNWPCKIGERCTLQNYICTGESTPSPLETVWSTSKTSSH